MKNARTNRNLRIQPRPEEPRLCSATLSGRVGLGTRTTLYPLNRIRSLSLPISPIPVGAHSDRQQGRPSIARQTSAARAQALSFLKRHGSIAGRSGTHPNPADVQGACGVEEGSGHSGKRNQGGNMGQEGKRESEYFIPETFPAVERQIGRMTFPALLEMEQQYSHDPVLNKEVAELLICD